MEETAANPPKRWSLRWVDGRNTRIGCIKSGFSRQATSQQALLVAFREVQGRLFVVFRLKISIITYL